MSPQVQELVNRGALFVVNHSGGKDSQAMLAYLRGLIPAPQLLVIHANLPGVEWEGTEAHARATSAGLDFISVRAGKTFLDMVRARGMFPSPAYRQCTSDLKRGPIEKAIRSELKRRGLRLVVNCMGLRAEESTSRSKLEPFKRNARNSVAGREWYDWLPIHAWTVSDVWLAIKKAGQQPHWAYAAGMSRLSCVFCIMASPSDLRRAAELNPTLYADYVGLERRLGQSMLMPGKDGPRFLEDVTGIRVAAEVGVA